METSASLDQAAAMSSGTGCTKRSFFRDPVPYREEPLHGAPPHVDLLGVELEDRAVLREGPGRLDDQGAVTPKHVECHRVRELDFPAVYPGVERPRVDAPLLAGAGGAFSPDFGAGRGRPGGLTAPDEGVELPLFTVDGLARGEGLPLLGDVRRTCRSRARPSM